MVEAASDETQPPAPRLRAGSPRIDDLPELLAGSRGGAPPVWMLSGPSGSGKSAWLRRFAAEQARLAIERGSGSLPILLDASTILAETSLRAAIQRSLYERGLRGVGVRLMGAAEVKWLLLVDGVDRPVWLAQVRAKALGFPLSGLVLAGREPPPTDLPGAMMPVAENTPWPDAALREAAGEQQGIPAMAWEGADCGAVWDERIKEAYARLRSGKAQSLDPILSGFFLARRENKELLDAIGEAWGEDAARLAIAVRGRQQGHDEVDWWLSFLLKQADSHDAHRFLRVALRVLADHPAQIEARTPDLIDSLVRARQPPEAGRAAVAAVAAELADRLGPARLGAIPGLDLRRLSWVARFRLEQVVARQLHAPTPELSEIVGGPLEGPPELRWHELLRRLEQNHDHGLGLLLAALFTHASVEDTLVVLGEVGELRKLERARLGTPGGSGSGR